MLPDQLLNPFGMNPSDELPHAPEEKPNWTECYYFFSHDRESGYSISVHYAREPSDPDVWRVLLGVYLPGDGLLVGRCFGRDGTADGPGAGAMQARCLEPMRRWSLRFDGMLEVSDRVSSSSQLHASAILEVVNFDLVFEGAAPMWDLGASDLSTGFVFDKEGSEKRKTHHWEQIGRTTGTINIAGQTHLFNGVGNRDHSFGPRDYAPLESSMWVNALFPSGKAMMLMGTRVAGRFINGGYIFRNDGSPLEVVRLVEAPTGEGNTTPACSMDADSIADPTSRHFRVVAASKTGEEIMTGELTHCMSSTNFTPSHELLGTGLSMTQRAFQFNECAVRYAWDGEEGAGHFERITEISKLRAGEGKA